MQQFTFEKLHAWHKAKDLVKLIYQVTKAFPKEELFGLTNQVRRAAVSVASNLAEGSTRHSDKDRAHFISIAYSSLMEVLNQCILAHELSYLPETDYLSIRKQTDDLSRMLSGLRNAYLRKP
ncbi:MAG: four helix bundle protein [Saprospirales bacterium]|nr:four helix bundle protein [Saprospirales bacterium]